MKKFNIFTFLMLVTVFALVLRILDISNFSIQESVAESSKSSEKVLEIRKHKEKPSLSEKRSEEKATNYGEESYSRAEINVLKQLSSRRAEIDKRENIIKKKEALLQAAEGEVDKKIAELEKIKKQLESLLKEQDTINQKRLVSLVKIYEGMKPKQAARIFDTLNMDILMAVISKMSERKTSPILANMNPKRAREVTTRLAEQYQLPD